MKAGLKSYITIHGGRYAMGALAPRRPTSFVDFLVSGERLLAR